MHSGVQAIDNRNYTILNIGRGVVSANLEFFKAVQNWLIWISHMNLVESQVHFICCDVFSESVAIIKKSFCVKAMKRKW